MQIASLGTQFFLKCIRHEVPFLDMSVNFFLQLHILIQKCIEQPLSIQVYAPASNKTWQK